MGHEILYCARCQGQLRSADFDRGAAVRAGDRAYCLPCAKAEGISFAPPKTTRTLAAVAQPRPTQRRVAAPAKGRGMLVAGIAGGAAVLLAVIIAVASSSPRPDPTPVAPPPPHRPPIAVKPKEPERPPPREAFEKDLAPLDGRVRALCERKDFDGARRTLREARARHADGEWAKAIDLRLKDLDAEAGKAKPPEKPAIDPALVAHWTFDRLEGGRAPDASGKGNDATLLKGPAAVEGKMGGALSVDGKGACASAPDSPSLSLTGPFTVAAWVKPAAAATPRMQQGVVEKWDSGPAGAQNGYFLRIAGDGKAKIVVADATSTESATGTTVLPVGAWTHIAGVFDGEALKVYVDGRLERSGPTKKAPTDGASTLTVGMAPSGGNRFAGAIDDARVYGRALAAGEIAALAAAPR